MEQPLGYCGTFYCIIRLVSAPRDGGYNSGRGGPRGGRGGNRQPYNNQGQQQQAAAM